MSLQVPQGALVVVADGGEAVGLPTPATNPRSSCASMRAPTCRTSMTTARPARHRGISPKQTWTK